MSQPAAESVPARVRAGCAWVARRARFVEIERTAIERYAHELAAAPHEQQLDPDTHFSWPTREQGVAYVLCLDAINFGSGWWPTIRKPPGYSGYRTIAAGLTERFRAEGAWSAQMLMKLSASQLADVLGQDPRHPLMGQFAASLANVGRHVLDEHGGSFAAVADAAGGSAVALADRLARWDAFADESPYRKRQIAFFKRAQLAAADLNRAGLAELRDEHELTAFADNLVPHVLRIDGVVRLEHSLAEKIGTGQLLIHDSAEEVELRACAVQAVELLANALGRSLSPAQLDGILWNRGGLPRYKAIPRPRSRNRAY
jgi:Queuosine salvage protein